MNSKNKGNIGEAIVLAEFTKRNIQVCIPFGDNARYDLVAEFNGKLNKIQVKYCGQETINNSFECPCVSSTNHTTNKHLSTYENDVDYMAFYIIAIDKILLIPIDKISGRKTITFRTELPKNGQRVGVNFVEDYLLDKIIES